MICKNCKTAVEDNAIECNNCGATLNNNNNKWKLAVGILFAASIGLVYFLNSDRFTTINHNPAEAAQTNALSLPPASNAASNIQEKPVTIEQPVYIEEPVPVSVANLDKPIDEVWEIVDEAVRCVNDYYNSYRETVAFLAKNGYLYDNPAKAYVLVGDMDALTDIDEKYLEESLMFFYLKPGDLFEYSYLRVSESNELKIFAGLETRDGFAIAAENEQGGIINREDLKVVLDNYSWEHGLIRKIEFQSDEFEQIIKILGEHIGNSNGFDVRYMYRDDKYICVVASPKGQPMEVSQYILHDTGDILNIEISEIETINNHRAAINQHLPDLNQSLLPTYDLENSLKYLKNDFTDIIEAMLEAAFISEDDSPYDSFASGTSDFVYLEFNSGKRFVGHLDTGTWKMYPIENDEIGRELMWNINKKAPVFIIKQY